MDIREQDMHELTEAQSGKEMLNDYLGLTPEYINKRLTNDKADKQMALAKKGKVPTEEEFTANNKGYKKVPLASRQKGFTIADLEGHSNMVLLGHNLNDPKIVKDEDGNLFYYDKPRGA